MRLRIILLLSLISSVLSQQCQQFDSNCAPASGETCLPYVSPQVWLPLIPNAITFVDSNLNKSIFWQIKAAKPILSFTCFDALTSLLCNAAWPPCNYSDSSPSIALSFPACRSVCENVNEVCSSYFNTYKQPFIDCTQINLVTGQNQWPEKFHQNSFLDANINSSCTTELPKLEPSGSQISCPSPLNSVDNPGYGAPCAPPCLDPTWTPHEWKTLATVDFTFAEISCFCQLFLLIHYLADPRCRKPTKRFQLYSFFTQALLSIGFAIGGSNPMDSVWCTSPTTPATFHDSLCGTQAVLILIFGISSANWWAISSAIMYKQLENHKFKVSIRREIVYHVIAFGFPLLLFLVGLEENVIKFSGLTPFCFVQNKQVGHSPLNYQWALFFIPLGVSIAVAICFIIGSMIKIIRHNTKMKRSFSMTQLGGVSLAHVNLRLLIWCSVLFLYFCNLVIQRAGLEKHALPLQKEGVAWVTCRVLSELRLGPDTNCPEPHFSHPISFKGSVFHYIVACSVGTLTFLAFGTSATIYHFWFFAARLVRRREWAKLRELFTDEKVVARETREYWGEGSTRMERVNSSSRYSSEKTAQTA